MSNDESAMAAGSSIRFKSGDGAALSSLALRAHTTWSASTAGCPSGQWKRTVNPSVYTYAGSNPAPATTFRRLSLSKSDLADRGVTPTGTNWVIDECSEGCWRLLVRLSGCPLQRP